MHNVQWLEPGTPVDRYVVQDRLGEGGMAKVYEVTHAVLGTRHALKVLHSRSDAISERLLREGRLQARLDPAYVIPVTDVIEIDGSPALVMPLVDGCSLAELLDDHRPTESEVGAIFANVVAGVASAHDAGVVHRDLKPTNVLLEIKRGQVHIRVADFGVARAVDVDHGQTRAGAMMGTPAYAAPEQIHDASTADHRADLWSLGVILFELLTGKRPFRADSLAGLFRASAAGDYDHTAVPERWRSVVDSLLQPDRTERLRSASELVNRLADMVEPVSLAVGSPVAEVVRLRVVGRAQERADLAESIEATLAPSTRHNLPQERDVFAGRERDLVALKDSVSHSLLVSVVGLGGVGKTRLVLHHCRRHLAEWPGGVRFCDLSDARSVQGICYAVGRALDVPLGAGDPVAQLGGAIASRGRCLMILDNFEQVARYASETVGQWLDRDTEAVFVVTTREVLGLPGETVLSLAPLDLSDSVEMFIARAEAAKQGFCANDDDRAVIAELVALLDHLPLAIELAAARVRVMPPRKMVLRMNDRFRLLTSTRGRGERQSTLRATLDWSWDLLEPWEQSALAQTSVFEGGFDLEAVESVLELHDDAPWALDVVQALVDKSLVRPLGEGRFDLLVSVQEYAAEQLAKVGADDVQVRHGRHYAAFGDERAIEALSLHGGPALRKALALELGNLVSSTGRAVARGDAEVAGATALAAAKVMDLTGPFHTEIAILRAAWQMSLSGPESPNDRVRAGKLRRALGFALDRSGRPDLALVHYDAVLATHRESGDRRQQGFLLIDLGALHWAQGRMDVACAHLDEALIIRRAEADRRGEAIILNNLGLVHWMQGRMNDALAHFNDALRIIRTLGDGRFEGMTLGNLGILCSELGRMDEARANYEASLVMGRELGDRRTEGHMLTGLGHLHMVQGRLDQAGEHYDAALVVNRDLGDRRNEGITVGFIGKLYAIEGRMEEARAHLEEALGVHREVGNRAFEAGVLCDIGELHWAQGRMDEARTLLDEALVIHRELGDCRGEGVTLGALGDLCASQHRNDEARAHFEAGEAVLRPLGDPVPVGQVLCGRARWLHALADSVGARAALTEAESLAEQAGAGPKSKLGSTIAEVRTLLQASDR